MTSVRPVTAVRAGWEAFQRRNGLVADGVPGPLTLARVLELEDRAAEEITREIPTQPPRRRTAGGRRIDWIVIHHNGVPGRDIEDIRRSHVEGNGWSDVGYHRVYLDGARAGEMQMGRPPHKPGAHARDFNDHSLGYCLIGNGDEDVFEEAQLEKLRADLRKDLDYYGLTPMRVIGHYEVNEHTGPNDYKTHKHCPGRFLDMDAFRASLAVPHA